MPIVLKEVQSPGTEVQCAECGAVVHCEDSDWKKITYYKHDRKKINETIDCPNCFVVFTDGMTDIDWRPI